VSETVKLIVVHFGFAKIIENIEEKLPGLTTRAPPGWRG
jgi:hypothetical protein